MHVVLTAAVTPNVTGPVSMQDPVRRRSEYIAALRAWQSHCSAAGTRLTIVETTGYGAGRLVAESGLDKVEGLDYSPSPGQRRAGKGAVEAAGLSAFVSSLDRDDIFVKVTGRLQLNNAQAILRGLTNPNSIYMRMTYGRPWADTRLFAMSARLWAERYADVGSCVDDTNGRYLEGEMGRRTLIALADGVDVARFVERPQWYGSSGSSGVVYQSARWAIRSRLFTVVESRVWTLIREKQV